jgi:hypothetical protein
MALVFYRQERKRQKPVSQVKKMDRLAFSLIVSRAKYIIGLINSDPEKLDFHRRHIEARFTCLSSLNWFYGDTIPCDRCGEPILEYTDFYLHRRKSYNRYFHLYCAMSLNLI